MRWGPFQIDAAIKGSSKDTSRCCEMGTETASTNPTALGTWFRPFRQSKPTISIHGRSEKTRDLSFWVLRGVPGNCVQKKVEADSRRS
jgi:hypothetical protein